jgi:hypothetical protein
MSGVISSVAAKFVIAGSALCLPVVVNDHPMKAAFDPGAATSRIAKPRGHHHSMRISVGAEGFDIDRRSIHDAATIDSSCGAVDLVIGKDVIAQHVWDVDLAKRRLRLVVPEEQAHAIRKYRLVPASTISFAAARSTSDGNEPADLPVGTLAWASAPWSHVVLDLANKRIGIPDG